MTSTDIDPEDFRWGRPCPPDKDEDRHGHLQDIIETQARTIRYLLSNYEALLRKVERGEHHEEEVQYSVGIAQAFQNGSKIASGWWIPLQNAMIRWPNFAGGFFQPTTPAGAFEPIFSDGNAEALASFSMVPITTKIVKVAPTPV